MDQPSLLIIDDEPRIREGLSILLDKHFTVLTASDGKEGLSMIDKHLPSLVLLDLNMPGMTGLEVLEKVRKRNDHVNVIIMTGRIEPSWREKCMELNAQGFIEKPFDINELMEQIEKVSAPDVPHSDV